jgi:hypothetical protein
MLNKDNVRELAYVVTVDAIEPIEGKDRVEAAVDGGWRTMVRKGVFKPGDLGIYIEIDSKTPETAPFEFLSKYHYKVKTQKFKQFYSQGLLMHPSDFGWTVESAQFAGGFAFVKDDKGNAHIPGEENMFLTKQLGITYALDSDNKRKAPSVDKYKKMAQRHPDLFKKNWARWMMKRDWGKKIMFFFFGKAKDKNTSFPTHFPYVQKTDQERCENMKWVLEDKTPFIVTQKCDGSSGTYILERKPFGRFEFYVCSRNVRQLNENQKCFYEENYYWEVAKKYKIEEFLKAFLKDNPNIKYACLQGEVCSPKIQGNPHKLTETHFYAFHFTDSEKGRWDIRNMKKLLDKYCIQTVPIVNENYILPDNFEEFKQSADGFYDPEVCEGWTQQPREGFVYYKTTDPNFSFKNVSRSYLLKHE